MAATRGTERIRQAVEAQMAARQWNINDLAIAAGVDPGTVSDLLNGLRNPRMATLAKIEQALGWPAGAILQIGVGEPVNLSVRPVSDGAVMLDLPPEALEGLGPAEREEIQAAAKATALERAREIRRRLSD